MKLYRMGMQSEKDGSQGFRWFTSKTTANKAGFQWRVAHNKEIKGARASFSIEEVELPKADRTNIVALLDKYAGHPDNG